MNNFKFVIIAAALLVASVQASGPAHAQSRQTVRDFPIIQSQSATQQQQDFLQNQETRRIQNQTRRNVSQYDRRTPAQVTEAAQAVARTAGLSCQVTESSSLGKTDADHELYEIACNGGVGYIIEGASPPRTFDCMLLAGQADLIRAQGGEVAANSVCVLPGNQNAMVVLAGYAQQAGVPCQIDAGKVAGATAEGNMVYEVGCPSADGYHIERTAQGWNRTDCLQAMSSNLTCEFTTVEEQAAAFKPLLVGSAIDDCDAQKIRLLAQNDTGRFIEIKCASDDGYVARVKDGVINQVYPCSAAQRIGTGCGLTLGRVAATSEQ